MPTAVPALPSVSAKAERLIALGVHDIAGLSSNQLHATTEASRGTGALLVIGPDRASPSALAPLLEHAGKTEFVVLDMPDVDDFSPIGEAVLPPGPLYVLDGLDRGDQMANWSPGEALPAILSSVRTPPIRRWCLGRASTPSSR